MSSSSATNPPELKNIVRTSLARAQATLVRADATGVEFQVIFSPLRGITVRLAAAVNMTVPAEIDRLVSTLTAVDLVDWCGLFGVELRDQITSRHGSRYHLVLRESPMTMRVHETEVRSAIDQMLLLIIRWRGPGIRNTSVTYAPSASPVAEAIGQKIGTITAQIDVITKLVNDRESGLRLHQFGSLIAAIAEDAEKIGREVEGQALLSGTMKELIGAKLAACGEKLEGLIAESEAEMSDDSDSDADSDEDSEADEGELAVKVCEQIANVVEITSAKWARSLTKTITDGYGELAGKIAQQSAEIDALRQALSAHRK